MKKKLLLYMISLCAFTTVQAQDSLQVKPQVSAPYRAAIGLRFSAGGPMGADLGISAKYFIGRQSALEAYSTLMPKSHYYLASLNYLWQPKLATADRIRPYAGIGAGMMRSRSGDSQDNSVHTNAVAIGTLGVEYKFKEAPIAISLDYRATFLQTGTPSPYISLKNTSNLGLGVKYTFR